MVDAVQKQREQSTLALKCIISFFEQRIALEELYARQMEDLGVKFKKEISSISPNFLPPGFATLLAHTSQSGSTRKQLKEQFDSEVTQPLQKMNKEHAHDDSTKLSQTAALMRFRDFESAKMDLLKTCFLKFSVICSIIVEFEGELYQTYQRSMDLFDPEGYVNSFIQVQLEAAAEATKPAVTSAVSKQNRQKNSHRVTFKDGIDVIGFSDTESKMPPTYIATSQYEADMLTEIASIKGGKGVVLMAEGAEEEHEEEEEEGEVEEEEHEEKTASKPPASLFASASFFTTPMNATAPSATAPSTAPSTTPSTTATTSTTVVPPIAIPPASSSSSAPPSLAIPAVAPTSSVSLPTPSSAITLTSSSTTTLTPASTTTASANAATPSSSSSLPPAPSSSSAAAATVLGSSTTTTSTTTSAPTATKPTSTSSTTITPPPAVSSSVAATIAAISATATASTTETPPPPPSSSASRFGSPSMANSRQRFQQAAAAVLAREQSAPAVPPLPPAVRPRPNSVISPPLFPPVVPPKRISVYTDIKSPNALGIPAFGEKNVTVQETNKVPIVPEEKPKVPLPPPPTTTTTAEEKEDKPKPPPLPHKTIAVLPPPLIAPNGTSRSKPKGANSNPDISLKPIFTETMNCQFSKGELKRCEVLGQVAFSGSIRMGTEAEGVLLSLKGRESMESVVPNKAVLETKTSVGMGGLGTSESFSCKVKALQGLLSSGNPVPAIKYRLNPSMTAQYFPLAVSTAWKCEPTLTSIIINYKGIVPPDSAVRLPSPLTLNNLTIEVKVNGGVSVMQAKPDAVWNAAEQTARWTIGDCVINRERGEVTGKLLARFTVQQASVPSLVSASFSIDNAALSNASIQVTEEEAHNVELQPAQFRILTGTYVAA